VDGKINTKRDFCDLKPLTGENKSNNVNAIVCNLPTANICGSWVLIKIKTLTELLAAASLSFGKTRFLMFRAMDIFG